MAYRRAVHLFFPLADETGKGEKLKRIYENRPLDRITRQDLLEFVAFLRSIGNAPRTIRNRVDHLQIFFQHQGLKPILVGKDLPRYTEKKSGPIVATSWQAVCTRDTGQVRPVALLSLHRYAGTGGQVCLLAGCRSRRKTYTITEHLDLGYRPKDKEEGSLPISDLLVEVLKARRARYPRTRLIFPGKHGKPNGRLLITLKRLALHAGANYGHCINKKGRSCAFHPVCKQFVLHKLRKTFATMLHHNGLPAQTLQRYLRHSGLETTIKYIADADDATIRTTINSTFQGFVPSVGAAA